MTNSLSYPQRVSALRMSWFERGLLAIGLFEIPLQLDTYLMYHEGDGELGAVAGFNVSLMLLCLIALYWQWIMQIVTLGPRRINSISKTLGYTKLYYVAAVFISTLAASSKLLSLFDTFMVVQAYLLFFYLANRLETREDFVWVLKSLMAVLFCHACLLILLKSMGSALHGMETAVGPINLQVWSDGRPAGTMQSAVLAGSVLAMIMLPISGLLFSRPPKYLMIAVCIVVMIGGLGILVTQTRGAILTVMIGGMMLGVGCLIRDWLPKHTVLVLVIGGLVSIAPAVDLYQKRVKKGDEGSAKSREHLAGIAFDILSDGPIFGYGAGNCHRACQKYGDQGQYRSEWYYTIHCKYLLVWIETGLLGLGFFLLALGSSIRDGFLAWHSRNRFFAPIGLAISAAIIGQMVHMIVDIFNSRLQVQFLWVLFGLAFAARSIANKELADSNDQSISTTGVAHD